jgi:hypothetical protein
MTQPSWKNTLHNIFKTAALATALAGVIAAGEAAEPTAVNETSLLSSLGLKIAATPEQRAVNTMLMLAAECDFTTLNTLIGNIPASQRDKLDVKDLELVLQFIITPADPQDQKTTAETTANFVKKFGDVITPKAIVNALDTFIQWDNLAAVKALVEAVPEVQKAALDAKTLGLLLKNIASVQTADGTAATVAFVEKLGDVTDAKIVADIVLGLEQQGKTTAVREIKNYQSAHKPQRNNF